MSALLNRFRRSVYCRPAMTRALLTFGFLSSSFVLACGGPEREPPAATPATEPSETEVFAAEGFKVDRGIDLATKTIKLGVLNDESGPAAGIGKPYAVGKRILAAQINAGGSGLLPEGWKIELVERDHGYDPTKSVQAYREIGDSVLLFAHSFGTPNTLPLRPMLTRDQMLALPASLSSVSLLIQPVVAALAAWAIFGEAIGAAQFAGGAIVLAGIWIAKRASPS